ncbi:ABC transporter substrate-binding protein [Actinocatenispora rupis]|uniref:Peptide ABC transporter substrate-binding protein n=1 Tax=Actinocatenispora rupis TaxID=519421 RepID=A0A8J3J5X6_9ACTN|nr:peptide ABC transporter substrate-binding protein [Actinocatenispora rupis]
MLGTTDKVTSLDPAGAYDLGSWTLMYNMYQTLLKIPVGSTTPQPDAATCSFSNPTTYRCVLRGGLTFSNGDPLTATDAKFTFDRMLAIKNPNGPSSLFSSLKSTAAPDAKTVVFTLNQADATFPYVLSTAAGALVDHKVFPASKLLADSNVIGSGRYVLSKYQAGQQAVFKPNTKYSGDEKLSNGGFIVHYFAQPSALKLAIQQGSVDVAYRNLSPTDLTSLKSNAKLSVIEGKGTEIRYVVFDFKTAVGGNAAVRKAVAQVIDRQAIASNAYNNTVKPLYSLIPNGLAGATESYKDTYGTSPDVAKAKATLASAGVKTPVALTLGWTPSHYGPNLADEATQIQRQLQASGLFKVTLKDAEWTQYQTLYKQGAYDAYLLGWFPDYPDADDYTLPFLVKGGFYQNGYDNPAVDSLVAQEKASSSQATRNAIFAKIQTQTAKDVPVVPTWQGGEIAVAGTKVTGVESTLDPSYTFRFWVVGKKG